MANESKPRFTWLDLLLTFLTFGIWGFLKLNDLYLKPNSGSRENNIQEKSVEREKEPTRIRKTTSLTGERPASLSSNLAKIPSFFSKYATALKNHRLAYKLLTLGLLTFAAITVGWLGFNALALLSDVNCDVSCRSTAQTNTDSGYSFLGSDIDCRTDCDTSCTAGFSFGYYQSAPNCDTYCDTRCSSPKVNVDVDVNCYASCGLYPPRISLESLKTLFTPTYLRILFRRSFGL